MSAGGHTKKENISGKSRLSKYVLVPFRGLRWMRNLYVRKIMSCADGINNYGTTSHPGVAMSRAQSVRSTAEDDLRELIRAASQRDGGSRLDMAGKVGMGGAPGATTPYIERVPRSQSVAVGRIDEDKPMEFDPDVKPGPLLFPRSRSEAPMKRQRMASRFAA